MRHCITDEMAGFLLVSSPVSIYKVKQLFIAFPTRQFICFLSICMLQLWRSAGVLPFLFFFLTEVPIFKKKSH